MLTPSSSAPTLRIAIYRTSSIGDVVLATACLDLLRQIEVPTEILWLGRGAALETIAASWPEVRVMEVKRDDTILDLQKTIESLAGCHLFIDLQCNLRSRWLGKQLRLMHGVPYFLADKEQLRRNRLLLEARMRGRRKSLPEKARQVSAWQYQLMTEALKKGLRQHLPVEMRGGVEAEGIRPRLPIPDSFDSPWRKELRLGGWLGVAPGAAHPTKAAPVEIFAEILEKVHAGLSSGEGQVVPPLGLAFFGDSHDRQACRQLLDSLSWRGPVLNLAGKLSLWESAVALRETTCLLSNDSSLGHIAESVDTPVSVLFGPTIESFGFAPRMRQSRSFSSAIGCRPCSKHGRLPCRFEDKQCFRAIDTDEVSRHIISLINAPDARFRKRAGNNEPPKKAETDLSSQVQV